MFRRQAHPHASIPRPIHLHPALALLTVALVAAGCASTPTTRPVARPTVAPVALDPQLGQETLYVTTTVGQSTTNAGFLEAINPQTGAPRWKYTSAGTIGVPVVANGRVYVAPDDGTIRAVDAATGKQVWTFTRTVGVSQQTGLDGYPAIAGGTLFVCSDGGAVYALDATTGKQHWLFTAPADAHGHIYTAPAVANGLVYVAPGGHDATFYALDVASGAVRWRYATTDALDGVPALVNNTIYVGSDGFYSVYALDARTGNVLWHTTNLANVISRPAVGDGLVFVGGIDQKVSALSQQTGQVAWSFQTGGNAPPPPLPTGAAVTLSGSVLYVGGQGGVLDALDAASGKVLWQRTVDSAIDSAPAVVDGAVFVASDNGTVYAFRASDGAPAWSYHASGVIYASPVITP